MTAFRSANCIEPRLARWFHPQGGGLEGVPMIRGKGRERHGPNFKKPCHRGGRIGHPSSNRRCFGCPSTSTDETPMKRIYQRISRVVSRFRATRESGAGENCFAKPRPGVQDLLTRLRRVSIERGEVVSMKTDLRNRLRALITFGAGPALRAVHARCVCVHVLPHEHRRGACFRE